MSDVVGYQWLVSSEVLSYIASLVNSLILRPLLFPLFMGHPLSLPSFIYYYCHHANHLVQQHHAAFHKIISSSITLHTVNHLHDCLIWRIWQHERRLKDRQTRQTRGSCLLVVALLHPDLATDVIYRRYLHNTKLCYSCSACPFSMFHIAGVNELSIILSRCPSALTLEHYGTVDHEHETVVHLNRNAINSITNIYHKVY
jgi:hypothetical protein